MSWSTDLFKQMDEIADKAAELDGVPRYRGDVKIVITTDGPTSNRWAVGAFIGEYEVDPIASGTSSTVLAKLLEELKHRASLH